MTGIQLLLSGGALGLFVYYILRIRNALIDLVVLTVFMGLSVFFILSPEKTNTIAHKLGVGRGADLLFYCCILFFAFMMMKLFGRIRRMEKKLTELVRDNAKNNAVDLSESKKLTD